MNIDDLNHSISMLSRDVGEIRHDHSLKIAELRSDINSLCDVISEFRKGLDAFQAAIVAVDEATSKQASEFHGDLQNQINQLRQELEQDKVIERVFGDEGES